MYQFGETQFGPVTLVRLTLLGASLRWAPYSARGVVLKTRKKASLESGNTSTAAYLVNCRDMSKERLESPKL